MPAAGERRRLVDQAPKADVAQDLDPTAVLAATFGAVPDASVPTRDEWDRG